MQEQPAHTFFDGIIVTSFDQILGAIPTVTYPQGFITDEAARNTAEDAMLLLSVGKRKVIFSVMSFPKISKIGVVGIWLSTVESPLAVTAVFGAEATRVVWRTYPLIRSLIAREMQAAKQQPANAAPRLFKEIQEICECSSDENGLGRLKERLDASIDNTIIVANSLVDAGQIDKLGKNAPELKRSLTQLVVMFKDFRVLLNEKCCSDRGDRQLVQLQSVGQIGERVAEHFHLTPNASLDASVVKSADSVEKNVARFIKGVFMSRFDLSIGPIPVARYPADFVSEEQSNTIAMISMLQLNAAKTETTTTILTFDDIEAIGIGTLGRLSTIGFYSLIVFLSISAPRWLSESVDNVLRLLVDFNTRLKNASVAQDSLVKELFAESCKILEPSGEEFRTEEDIDLSGLDDSIMKIVSLVTPLISGSQSVIETLGIPLAESIVDQIRNLLLLAASFDSSDSCSSLCDLLFKIERPFMETRS